MLLPKFSYYRPKDIPEALRILNSLAPDAGILAGGTDLLVNMKNKMEQPADIVSLGGIRELKGIDFTEDTIRIGSGTPVSLLARNNELNTRAPALAQAAAGLGSVQIRNRATIGGNICSARPAADLIPPLLVHDAKLSLAGPEGNREVSLNDFVVGSGITTLKPGEILTSIVLNKPMPLSGGMFMKLGVRRAMEIARVSVAVFLRLNADSEIIEEAGVALGAVGPRAVLSNRAEEILLGEKAHEQLFARAGEAAIEDASPRTCHEFKCEVISVLTRRCLITAWRQAREAS